MMTPSNISTLNKWLHNMVGSNLPPDTDLEVLRKIYLLNLIILLGTTFLGTLGVLAFIQKAFLLGSVDFLILFILLGLYLYLRRTKHHELVGKAGTIMMGVFFGFLVAHGGVNNTAYVWVYTYPLVTLFLLGSGLGTVLSLLLLGTAHVVFALKGKCCLLAAYDTDLILRFTASYLSVTLIAFVIEKVRHITHVRLRIAKTKLEETVEDLEKAHAEKDDLIVELQQAFGEVKTLRGILPICASCKKIRDDGGYWQQVEEYVRDHSGAEFSHSICPDCMKRLYPDLKLSRE